MNDSDSALARELADAAGALLLQIRAAGGAVGAGAGSGGGGGGAGGGDGAGDGADLRKAGDAGSHQLLMELLERHAAADAVLSEEGLDDPARLTANRVWIVDPLDGTREFGEVPRTDWAVHVALWEAGDLVAGAVARPAAGSTVATDDPPVRPEGRPEVIRLAVSRSRPPAFVQALAQRLDAELVPMGSAGIKATAVLDDTADAYVHAGGQFEWDSAAPVAVARAAGLHTSRIDGSPLEYNRPDPKLPDLLICRPEIADDLLAAIAELQREGIAS